MSVVRVNKTKDFTIMSNHHLREKRMSLKAKGLLSMMLSLPDEWDYSISGLCAVCKENITAIRSTLDELQDFGYLVITKKYPNETDTGRIEYVYDIFEQPQEKQDTENLYVENQSIENHIQLNTKELKTKNKIKKNTGGKKSSLQLLGKKTTKTEEVDVVKEIIMYLNEKAGKRYNPTVVDTRNAISGRLNAGYTAEQCKAVIDYKVKEWKGTEMEKYLRPSTLFRPSNFENYVNNLDVPIKTKNGVKCADDMDIKVRSDRKNNNNFNGGKF